MSMYEGFIKASNDLVKEASLKYNEVCTQFTQGIARLQADDPIATSYNYVGRQVGYLKNEVLPALQRHTPEAVTSLAKNAFWVVPVVALSLGHFSDAVTGTFAGAVSLLSSHPDAKKLSEHLAIAGLGTSIAMGGVKVLQLIATRNPSCVISIIFNLFNAVKYGMIIDGRNR
jgi:hypothetical protein